jgi:hypothetical protein
MLLSIAIAPMVFPNWWDSNRNKALVSVLLSFPVLGVILPCDPRLLLHSLLDYVSFSVLLGALFVISGGIHIKGEFAGTPLVNTVFLAIGALLSNVIGRSNPQWTLWVAKRNSGEHHGSVFMGATTYILDTVNSRDRKWAEFHGEKHCRAFGHQDAVIWALHAVFRHNPHPDLHPHDIRVLSPLDRLLKMLLTRNIQSMIVVTRHSVVA